MIKKIKQYVILFATVSIIMAGASIITYGTQVNVTLPSFNVILNGQKMDNAFSQYPLIVYKDITYFPMTYYDCRFLGLETAYTTVEGLKIIKTGTCWDYKPYHSSKKNQSSYRATVAKLPIKVNNDTVDNSKETYPLLQFRNVTYFPLTWNFAVNSFGWNYEFNQSKGLSIQAERSSSLSVQERILPIAKFSWGDDSNSITWGGFTKLREYYYYQGDKGIIYQASVSNPNRRKAVYQLPNGDGYRDGYPIANLYTYNNKVYLSYHCGGGFMGCDLLIHIKEDGTQEDISPARYYTYHEFSEITVVGNRNDPLGRNNLLIKQKGETEYKSVGNPSYYYSLSSDGDYVRGDSIFTLANANEDCSNKNTYLYKVNYKTGETTRLCDALASLYAMGRNEIYFSGYDYNGLYKVDTDGGQEEKLSDAAIYQLAVLEDTLFYITRYDGLLYKEGTRTSLNPESIATNISIKDGYLYAYFSNGPYKVMIFDKEGSVIAKTMEKMADVFIENGKLVYVK